MAGLEKVCEFSGEYPGWLMYGYKRNHIQILPKYRKNFRKVKAVLHVIKPEICCVYKYGGYSPTSYKEFESLKKHGQIKADNFKDFLKEWYPDTKVKNHFSYMLVVEDENLKGEVEGHYYNRTFELKDTIKRLKRMLRCRNLKVVKHDCYDYEN